MYDIPQVYAAIWIDDEHSTLVQYTNPRLELPSPRLSISARLGCKMPSPNCRSRRHDHRSLIATRGSRDMAIEARIG